VNAAIQLSRKCLEGAADSKVTPVHPNRDQFQSLLSALFGPFGDFCPVAVTAIEIG
jgi:hypothetical protein